MKIEPSARDSFLPRADAESIRALACAQGPGCKQVILVLNNAYGGPELIPFDPKMRRVICNGMPKDTGEHVPERK